MTTLKDQLEKLKTKNRPSTGDAWGRDVEGILGGIIDVLESRPVDGGPDKLAKAARLADKAWRDAEEKIAANSGHPVDYESPQEGEVLGVPGAGTPPPDGARLSNAAFSYEPTEDERRIVETGSIFGTPRHLLPEGAVEFESEGMRALRFVGARGYTHSIRVRGEAVFEVRAGEAWVSYPLDRLPEILDVAVSQPWLRHHMALYPYTEEGEKPESATAEDDLPAVLLEVDGDVFQASGETSDGIAWSIYSEAESDDGARSRVSVSGVQVADITVHYGSHGLVQETQEVCAALVWSTVRAVRQKRLASSTGFSPPLVPEETVRRVVPSGGEIGASSEGGPPDVFDQLAESASDAVAKLGISAKQLGTSLSPDAPQETEPGDALEILSSVLREGSADFSVYYRDAVAAVHSAVLALKSERARNAKRVEGLTDERDEAWGNISSAISFIESLGHTNHCAHRLAFGDGECECFLIPRYRCRTCGCMWRTNPDNSLSLFNSQQSSCAGCEADTVGSCEHSSIGFSLAREVTRWKVAAEEAQAKAEVYQQENAKLETKLKVCADDRVESIAKSLRDNPPDEDERNAILDVLGAVDFKKTDELVSAQVRSRDDAINLRSRQLDECRARIAELEAQLAPATDIIRGLEKKLARLEGVETRLTEANDALTSSIAQLAQLQAKTERAPDADTDTVFEELKGGGPWLAAARKWSYRYAGDFREERKERARETLERKDRWALEQKVERLESKLEEAGKREEELADHVAEIFQERRALSRNNELSLQMREKLASEFVYGKGHTELACAAVNKALETYELDPVSGLKDAKCELAEIAAERDTLRRERDEARAQLAEFSHQLEQLTGIETVACSVAQLLGCHEMNILDAVVEMQKRVAK